MAREIRELGHANENPPEGHSGDVACLVRGLEPSFEDGPKLDRDCGLGHPAVMRSLPEGCDGSPMLAQLRHRASDNAGRSSVQASGDTMDGGGDLSVCEVCELER